MKKKLAVLILSLLSFTYGCNDLDSEPVINDFDRGSLLRGYADQLIIPNFIRLQTELNALKNTFSLFKANPSDATLNAMQDAWEKAVLEHQHCSAFGFGPAELTLGDYASVLGAFPTSEQKIEDAIIDDNFSLQNSFDRDLRGYYAIEYLIYGNNQTTSELISGFDANRINYLETIVNELVTTVNLIVDEWQNSYREAFINNTGTSRGSSISLLYNAFIKDYENIKNFKIELPAGLSAGQTGPDTTLLEARYSGISRSLLIENWKNSKRIYLGENRNRDTFTSFSDYLNAVEGGTSLVSTTTEAINTIDQAISNIPQGKLSDHIDSPEIRELRDLFQSNTANFKSSMSSLLGISITFSSGDGD